MMNQNVGGGLRQPAPPPFRISPYPAPELPIPFTRRISLADWIEVVLGVNLHGPRQSVAAQVLFTGICPDGQIGFAARGRDGTMYRGWEEPSLRPEGPCYAAIVISNDTATEAITKHRKVFSRALPLELASRQDSSL